MAELSPANESLRHVDPVAVFEFDVLVHLSIPLNRFDVNDKFLFRSALESRDTDFPGIREVAKVSNL